MLFNEAANFRLCRTEDQYSILQFHIINNLTLVISHYCPLQADAKRRNMDKEADAVRGRACKDADR